MNKNTLVQASRIIISFLFVFGAISKLVSMPFFDGMVAELFLGEDYFNKPKAMFWVQLATRVLVAIELVLGIALLQNKWFKKWVLPATMATLVLFTIHLFYEGFSKPNGFIEGNCGCFGDILPMNNLESILKNVVGLVLGVYVWLKYKGQDFVSWASPTLVGLVTMFTLSFGIKSFEALPESNFTLDNREASAPILSLDSTEETTAEIAAEEPAEETKVETTKPKEPEKEVVVPLLKEDEIDEKDGVEGPPLTAPADEVVSPGNITKNLLNSFAPGVKALDLNSGTKLVALFSMTCSHCQEVYSDICSMNGSGKLPKVHLVNYGSNYEENYFFSQAGDCKHPHDLIEDYGKFKRMLEGRTYPRILVYKNGELAKEWDVDSYTKSSFMNYFGVTESDLKKEEDDGGLKLEGGKSPW